MRFGDITLALIVGAFGAAVIVEALSFPEMAGMAYGPEFFPAMLGAGLCLSALALLVKGVREALAGKPLTLVTLSEWTRARVPVIGALGVLGAVVFFIAAADALGFILTSAICLAALFAALRAQVIWATAITLGFPFLIHFLFSDILRVPLQRGFLESWLF